jgi:hypothetical protein
VGAGDIVSAFIGSNYLLLRGTAEVTRGNEEVKFGCGGGKKLKRTYASRFTTIARISCDRRRTCWPADPCVFDLDARGRDQESTVAGQPEDSLGFGHPPYPVPGFDHLLLCGPGEDVTER